MLAASCCCWKTRKEKLHSAVRLKKSRSLDKVNLGQYTDLVLEDKFCDSDLNMGNSLATDRDEDEKGLHSIKKTESSASLKSSSSVKSSASRRSKVTFTETHPEVHMIPPKSPPKPKRSRGGNKPAAYSETESDLLMRDDESQAAFQFDLGQTAQVTSLEDLEQYNNNNNNNNNNRTKKKAKTPEDVQEVTECGANIPELILTC